jgi:hypothetical protein
MALGRYRSAPNRGRPPAGMPGKNAPPVFQLRVKRLKAGETFVELQACVWQTEGKIWEAINAWPAPRELKYGEDFYVEFFDGNLEQTATTTDPSILIIDTVEPMADNVTLVVEAGVKKLTSAEGWICEGIYQEFSF